MIIGICSGSRAIVPMRAGQPLFHHTRTELTLAGKTPTNSAIGGERTDAAGARREQHGARRGLGDAGGQRVEPRAARQFGRNDRVERLRRDEVQHAHADEHRAHSLGGGLAGRAARADGVREVMVTLCCAARWADDGPSWPRVGCVVGWRRSIRR